MIKNVCLLNGVQKADTMYPLQMKCVCVWAKKLANFGLMMERAVQLAVLIVEFSQNQSKSLGPVNKARI
ncbi:hypothetical protein BpHYR1_054356 [Brachionus plicatilis]|uniref:Uncharacterized protein n=1 Tax=Brachionus plicatilis TaxID=10195 RepID=A0A3M7RE54_BRAPC|nr:hypothetical protein BpHYR1_054356 [Brachionus plicatilis]